MASLMGSPLAAAAQTPAPPELTPLGKRLLEVAVDGQTSSGAPGILRDVGWWERDKTAPYPTCAFPGGLCGAVDRAGRVVVAPRFDWVDEFREGRALVRLRGLYGFIDAAGRIVVEPTFELANPFRGGYAQVVVGDKMGLIDSDGKTAMEPRFGYIDTFGTQGFWASTERGLCESVRSLGKGVVIRVYGASVGCGGSRLSTDGRPGLALVPAGKVRVLDRQGRSLNTVDLLGIASAFDGSNLEQMPAKTSSGWGVVRSDGTWAIEPALEAIGRLGDGLAPAKRDTKWGFIDRNGRWIVAPRFEEVGHFATGQKFTSAALDKRYGLIDRTGSWIIEPKFEKLSRIYSDFGQKRSAWHVMLDGKHGVLNDVTLDLVVIDRKLDQTPSLCPDGHIEGSEAGVIRLFTADGRQVVPPEGELVRTLACTPPYSVKVGSNYGLVDAQMRWIVRPELDQLSAFAIYGLAPAGKGGKLGVLRQDGSGTWALEPTFDALGLAQPGVYAASQGGKWGLIRLDKTWLVEPRYDAIELLPTGRLLVKRDGMAGMIDAKTEGWLIGPHAGDVCALSHGTVMVEAGGKRSLYDERTGDELIPPSYERIGLRFGDGLVQVLEGGKWGFADLTGRLVIPFVSDAQAAFDRGIAWIKTGATWCPIDRRGDRIAHLPCRDADPAGLGPPGHVCRPRLRTLVGGGRGVW